MGRKVATLARAGALAAGLACLLGVWFHGFTSLGLRGNATNHAPDFFGSVIPAVLVAAVLGFPEPASSLLALLGRLAGTVVFGCIAGAVVVGLMLLLVGPLDVAERDLVPFFVVMGAAGTGAGLRRLPQSMAARTALAAIAGLLLLTRLLALWPSGAHAVTQRVFPLPEAVAREGFDEHGCGPTCRDGRTAVVAFSMTPSYHLDMFRHLAAEASIEATLEVQRPFFVDSCQQVTDSRPEVPPEIAAFADRAACDAAHPRPKPTPWSENPHYDPGPCCVISVTEHPAKERLTVKRSLPFGYFGWEWKFSPSARRDPRR